MRRLSTEFLSAFLLVFCIWCYCFGNKRKRREKTKNGRKEAVEAKGGELEKSKNSRAAVVAPFATAAANKEQQSTARDAKDDKSTTTSNIELITVNECDMQKGYVNPDFYVPFIDSESDLSFSASNKRLISTSAVNVVTVNGTLDKRRSDSTTGRENKSFRGDNEVDVELTAVSTPTSTIYGSNTAETARRKSHEQNRDDNDNSFDNQDNSGRSICSSSVKSSDFIEVLETARKNEEEITQVRNSYYEKLSEASTIFVPISVHDELLHETVNFCSVTEELRKVGDKYLVGNVSSDDGHQRKTIQPDNTPSLLVIPKSESPDSGLESAKNSTNVLMDKLTVSTSVQDVNPPKSSLSPSNHNSKSSECIKRLVDDTAGHSMVKWRSAAEVTPKSSDKQRIGLLRSSDFNSTDNKQQVVTTTIVQTATTTLTQVSKRFSDNWKEYDFKTTRRRFGSSTRSSTSVSSDDLKDFHVTVQSEQGEPKALVDDTSRTVSQPRDHRVTNEYLTNLSHMLTATDQCAQFHKDSCHGSLASIDSVELTNVVQSSKRHASGDVAFERQEKFLNRNPSVKFEPATVASVQTDDDKSLSSVIASIANSLSQSRQLQCSITTDKAPMDTNGNALISDSQVHQHSIFDSQAHQQRSSTSAQIGTSLDASTDAAVCGHNNCTASICSTLVISLHLSPSNLTERNDGKADCSPLAKIATCLDNKLKGNTNEHPLPIPKTISPKDYGKIEIKFPPEIREENNKGSFKNYDKSPKAVVIEDVYIHENTKLQIESPEGSIYDNLENMNDDDNEFVEDINIRRSREAAAFAQKFFQYGYKYS